MLLSNIFHLVYKNASVLDLPVLLVLRCCFLSFLSATGVIF